MITAKGITGTVSFDGRMVSISHTGAIARGLHGKGEKRIPVRGISAVQWKEPTSTGSGGFIQFTLAGGIEPNVRKFQRTATARDDENSVVFTYFQRKRMRVVRAAIEEAMATPSQAIAPTYGVPVAPMGPPAGWYPDPGHPGQVLYWDGLRWVMETSRLA